MFSCNIILRGSGGGLDPVSRLKLDSFSTTPSVLLYSVYQYIESCINSYKQGFKISSYSSIIVLLIFILIKK